jgi:urate oxidase
MVAKATSETAAIRLAASNYGKARVRLVTVTRQPGRHGLRDLTVRVALEGDFEAAHTLGDNTLVVATDTMKNTAYALAKEYLSSSAETYGLALARHFLAFPQVSRSTVTLAEHRWSRLSTDGGPSDHAFMRTGDLTRTALISVTREGAHVEAGLEDLTVMKTTDSAFAGFPRDRFTTLPDTDDRIMATKITSSWRYGRVDIDFDASHAAILHTLLAVFAEHFSPSVQNSIWLMGEAVLKLHAEVEEIRFALPNLHHLLADLSPFGMTNDKEVYVATSEPHGLIEATIVRATG